MIKLEYKSICKNNHHILSLSHMKVHNMSIIGSDVLILFWKAFSESTSTSRNQNKISMY